MMSHRTFLYILFFLLLIFVGNIFLYNTSEDYQFLVKKLKYQDDAKILSDEINDNYTLEGPISESVQKDPNQIQKEEISTGTVQDTPTKQDEINDEKLEASQNAKDVMALLGGDTLTQTSTVSSLFDLTTEYPDEYLEFKSKDITIYYFGGKKYDEVVDIFFAISQGLPYSLNKNDAIGEKSFFINLNTEFQDDMIRIVFQSQKEVFGLKLKKDRYNAVKKSLEKLKK